MLLVLLRCTDNDYPFAIFKLFLDILFKCCEYEKEPLFVAPHSSPAIIDSYIEIQFNNIAIKVIFMMLQSASIESFMMLQSASIESFLMLQSASIESFATNK